MTATSLPASNRAHPGVQTSQSFPVAPNVQHIHVEGKKKLGEAKEIQFVRHPELADVQR